MLDVLVVFSHPDNKKSINALILQSFLKGLRQQKSSYTVLDLYSDNFCPVFSYDELRKGVLSTEVKQYHEIILNHRKMVFIYPAWNYGIPAILKGWLDRVLVIPDFSFKEDEKHRYLGGLLTHKKVLLLQTFGGNFLTKEHKGQLCYYSEPMRAILHFCGLPNVDIKYFFDLYSIPLEHEKIKRIQEECYKAAIDF